MADRRVTIGLFGDDRDLEQKIADAKRKLDDLRSKAATAKLGLDARDFDLEIRKAELKLEELNRKKASPNVDTAKARIELDRLDLSIDKTELKLDKLAMKGAPEAGAGIAAFGSKLGALSNYGMPALIAGLVMLGGQLVTVGVGMAAFGAAAFKDIDPIVKMAQRTGGLSANLDKLDPTQRKLALSLLGLGQDYNKFAASVKPEVFSSFNKGLLLADDLLKNTSPIAREFGKALTNVLGSIDREFQSGEWQAFFGYIEKNAGPDLQQLGHLFTDLLGAIPPLTEALHPFGAALITDLDEVVKFTGGLAATIAQVEKLEVVIGHLGSGSKGQANQTTSHLKSAISEILNPVQFALDTLGKAGGWLDKMFGGSNQAASGQSRLAQAERAAALAAQNEQKNMNALASSIDAVTNQILGLQNTDIAWHQALKSATQAVKANNNALDGNSNAALAAKSALLQSTQAAIKNADSQLTLQHNAQGASKTILTQIAYLQQHGQHSIFAQREILALVSAEAKLPRSITSHVHVDDSSARDRLAGLQRMLSILNGEVVTTYVSTQFVAPTGKAQGNINRGGYASGTPSAAPGWSWVGEKGPELVKMKGGETVVPSHVSMGMARIGAIPGYADGAAFAFPSFTMPQVAAPRIMGGNIYQVTVEVPPTANLAEIGRVTVKAIEQFEKRSGKRWRS